MDGLRHPGGGGGFTLLEILMVVVIIAIASAVAVPSFARSFRGAKLRMSARTVLGMHRQAQSKAVLGQRYAAILFDQVKDTLEMVDQGQPGAKKDVFFEGVGGGGSAGTGAAPTGADAPEGEAPQAQSLLVRKLEDGVKILSFRGGRELDGIHYVSYYPNGMCEGYEIEIGDEEKHSARIHVDAVTGKAKVERD